MRFAYQMRDAAGRLDSGFLNANSSSEASQKLRRDGGTVIRIDAAEESDAELLAPRKKRIRRDDVIFFATQLAVMVDTGVPLPEALDAIADQTDHTGLKAVVSEMCERVRGGVEFSAALEAHPKVFSKLFVAMMRASEASGTMGQMLQRVSEYMQRERETRKAVKGALTYPVCILSFSVLVVVGILIFILPRFESIYAGKGATLPLPTRVLMGMSRGIIDYWPLLAGGLVAGAVGLVFYLRSPGGRTMVDRVRIRMPVLGPMFQKSCLSRSLRTMATMVSSGVSMLDGLAITAQVAGNKFYSDIWDRLADRVKEGSSLAEPLYEQRLIPRTVTQMVMAGEKTGRLGMVLDRVAEFCEDDLRVAVKTATSMIEPIMIVVMGLIVGGIAMALLLPVLTLSKVVAR